MDAREAEREVHLYFLVVIPLLLLLQISKPFTQ